MEILLSLTYFALFLWIIGRMPFFSSDGLTARTVGIVFSLKVLSGFGLWLIYSYYYKERNAADIFKYFDDSKVMFDAIHTRPMDYFQMLFGLGNDKPAFNQYYLQMHNWAGQYESNLYNDNHTIIRLNALFRLFSLGYYQVHSVFISFLSLIGLVALYRSFAPLLPGKKKWVMVAVFFIPSVLLWGSGVLKEGVILFGIGLLIFHWFRLIQRGFSVSSLLWVAFSVSLLLATKFYILVSITPGLAYITWISRTEKRFVFLKFVVVMGAYAALGLGVKYFIPNYDPLQVLSIKQRDFVALAKGGALLRTDTAMIFLTTEQRKNDLQEIDHTQTYNLRPGTAFAYWHDYTIEEDTLFGKQGINPAVFTMENDMPRSGSLIYMTPLEPTVSSFLRSLPMALINTCLRPFPNEVNSLMLITPSLEIFVYLIFVCLCLFFRRKKVEHPEYALFCFSFAMILFVITGLTTAVLGALVRYKVPGLPFLLLSFIFMLDQEAVIKRIPFLKRMSDK